MPEGKGRQGEAWTVVLRPAGTQPEAAVALGRACRLVVGWIKESAAEVRPPCP
ncbi:MAG TPA: hypothetical protein VD969_18290 [Symbiobacteriaceae bacterium]|nr:hypothetical protein [Symbiobacteriaceae bacterium]